MSKTHTHTHTVAYVWFSLVRVGAARNRTMTSKFGVHRRLRSRYIIVKAALQGKARRIAEIQHTDRKTACLHRRRMSERQRICTRKSAHTHTYQLLTHHTRSQQGQVSNSECTRHEFEAIQTRPDTTPFETTSGLAARRNGFPPSSLRRMAKPEGPSNTPFDSGSHPRKRNTEFVG